MDPKAYLSSLEPSARLRLWLGVGLVVVLTASLLWWVFSPRQQLLFGNLDEADAAEIAASLDEWKVPHAFVDDGAGITVPADLVYETRMRLVSAGVPSGGHVGFELFDDADFGVTEFAQRVNYQRALQGEIERTIASLPGVETARVHLTIRRPGLFVGERESSKASVAVAMQRGRSLAREQVNGIRSLVASAVEGLGVDQVSVIDSSGALLAGAAGTAGAIGLSEREDEESKLEARIQARVSSLLEQFLRDEQFHVSVDATLNFDSVHEVSERPLAQGLGGDALLVRKRVSSSDAPDGGRSQNQEEAEFVHGTARAEISRAPGRIERLSVAVVLPPTLDEMQVARIQSLVGAAAGIDAERGDRLEVSRLGRNTAWQAAPAVAAQPVAVDAGETVADVAPAVPAGGPNRWVWLLVGVLGALVGAIAMAGARPRPRALKAEEHDAVLGRLRGWLAEGTPLP